MSEKLPEDPVAAERSLQLWRAHLEEEERTRQANFDRRKLLEHRALVERLERARSSYDRARTLPELKSAQATFRARVSDFQARLQNIDRWGKSSHVLGDYSALLDSFAQRYPDACSKALSGDTAALEQVRSEVDAHFKAVDEWLSYASNAEEE